MKDTLFCQKKTLNFRGKLARLSMPAVMGILNITPDSFYKDSRFNTIESVLRNAEKMISEGADLIDVGGYSSRPDAENIPEEEELKRVIPAIEAIRSNFPEVPLSVDTFRSGIARNAVDHGATMVNDISGGMLDEKMPETVAELRVPYVVMHMKGTPQTMKEQSSYENVIKEIAFFFSERIERLRSFGIADIILDPGIGFSKTIAQNFEILKNLTYFQFFGFPLMIGLSRKSLIYRTLNTGPENALNGTTVLHTIALMNQASYLRVHDVKSTKEVIRLVKAYLT